ncbi:MAG TPA: metal ABC transporter permease [Spirochaetia bacterium]|nr:metal ABC transporter permease [Spirochaetia bacterium]
MGDFFRALGDPSIPFLRYAFLAGIISSVAFGVIGSYVVVRRISYIAGAISHSVLAGIGFSLYVRSAYGITWITPMVGAVIAALLSAVIIGVVSMYAKEREDTVIGSIWSLGMAIGVLFIARTKGYVDPMSYLFGNVLLVTRNDLMLIGVLDVVVVVLGILFYNQFLAITFDEEFSTARGVPTGLYYLMLLVLTALAIVLLVTIVGIVMLIALFTIPAAIAGMLARRLWQVMIISALLTMLFTSAGLILSYATNLPSGSTIIVFAGGVYVLIAAVRSVIQRYRSLT